MVSFADTVKNSKPRSRVAVAVMLLLVVGAFYVLRIGLADIYAYQSKRLVIGWEREGSVESLQEWQRSKQWLDKALSIDGDHPEYLLSAGRLASWRFFIDADASDEKERQQIAEQGLNFVRSSIEQRPAWPLSWSMLLVLKSHLGQVDEEFYKAWENSKTLGPWEPQVQLTMLDIGLVVWSDLPWSERIFIHQLFQTLLARSEAYQAIDIAKHHKKITMLCTPIDRDSLPVAVVGRCG